VGGEFESLDETASFKRFRYSAPRSIETGFRRTNAEAERRSRVRHASLLENTPFEDDLVRSRLAQDYSLKKRQELLLRDLLLRAAANIGNIPAA
jgi:hypothetical protein